MICIECKLSFPDDIQKCPKCNKAAIDDRRVSERRKVQSGSNLDERRRSSDRRKQLIKRFEEVFWKGDAKYC